MFIENEAAHLSESVGAQCVSMARFAPTELGQIYYGCNCKHSAAAELKTFGCGPAAPCLCDEIT